MKIETKILDILSNGRIDGNMLYLPDIQLDRADYMAVNKVLEMLGSKDWYRCSCPD